MAGSVLRSVAHTTGTGVGECNEVWADLDLLRAQAGVEGLEAGGGADVVPFAGVEGGADLALGDGAAQEGGEGGGGVVGQGGKEGEEAFILLQLLDEPAKITVAGRVAWVTPQGCQGGKPAGVGIRFAQDEANTALRSKIETYLAGQTESGRPTRTL